MPGRSNGYVDPLLSGYAVDYSGRLRTGLVGAQLFPRVMVNKPDAKYAFFGLGNLSVPDTRLASNGGRPKRVDFLSEERSLSCEAHGLEDGFDISEMEYREGPFASSEKNKVRSLVAKLEAAQEVRIRNLALNVPGRFASLSGTGSGINNKWSGGNGKPYDRLMEAVDSCLWMPNVMVISKDVWRVLQNHPDFTGRVGEVQTTKRVTTQTIADLFGVEKVLIADGVIGPSRQNKNGTSMNDLSHVWNGSVVVAYVDDKQHGTDVNRAGSTFMVKDRDADQLGYVVSTWDDKEGGVKGERMVKVACQSDEKVVSPELIYAIKSIL